MKKAKFLALGAIAALAVSCNGGGNIETNVPLTSENDTLAYAYGVELADKGLTQYLSQLGVLQDTAQYRFNYNLQVIGAEKDSLKKLELQKALPAKLDSINKANKTNLSDFLSGLNESFNSAESKKAYLSGVEIGNQLKMMSKNMSKQIYGEDSKEELNKKAMLAGLVTYLQKGEPVVQNAGFVVESKMQKIQEENMKKQYAGNIEAGEKFLAENKAKEGVVTLPSGLQYKVIKEGKGEKPKATDRVKVNYHGTLLDGTVFDSSVQRGEPAVFGVNQVISGWTEALQLMPVGSKWEVYIPYNLAYGSRAAGSIQPFSTLIFEVELLSIEK
ncbi:MAG: FKBP-type peptidyl-prolyl cis-trans isomerase [Dysgonomonas sp.]